MGGGAELVQLVGPHTLTRGDGRRERVRIEVEAGTHLAELAELGRHGPSEVIESQIDGRDIGQHPKLQFFLH